MKSTITLWRSALKYSLTHRKFLYTDFVKNNTGRKKYDQHKNIQFSTYYLLCPLAWFYLYTRQQEKRLYQHFCSSLDNGEKTFRRYTKVNLFAIIHTFLVFVCANCRYAMVTGNTYFYINVRLLTQTHTATWIH